MKKALRRLMKLRLSSRHGSGRAFKKIIIIAAIAALLFIIGFIVLAVMIITWLFNQGGEHIQNASATVTQQTESLTAPLNLASYVQNGQVNTTQIEQAFAAVPAPLQNLWISQLESQINDLRSQAGLSDENLHILQALIESFKQISQQ
jgi:predicted PurR-regulated permease PerM